MKFGYDGDVKIWFYDETEKDMTKLSKLEAANLKEYETKNQRKMDIAGSDVGVADLNNVYYFDNGTIKKCNGKHVVFSGS